MNLFPDPLKCSPRVHQTVCNRRTRLPIRRNFGRPGFPTRPGRFPSHRIHSTRPRSAPLGLAPLQAGAERAWFYRHPRTRTRPMPAHWFQSPASHPPVSCAQAMKGDCLGATSFWIEDWGFWIGVILHVFTHSSTISAASFCAPVPLLCKEGRGEVENLTTTVWLYENA